MTQEKCCFLLFAALLSCFCCGGKPEQVERKVIDGVEIVVNHLEPYKVDQKRSLTLEELFKIDTEQTDIAELGVAHIRGFTVNSEGELFCLMDAKGAEIFVFKFDASGRYAASFASRGEGPGELQIPTHIDIDAGGHIVIVDRGRNPLNYFDRNGRFIEVRDLTRTAVSFTSGPGPNSLVLENEPGDNPGENRFDLKLMNSGLETTSTLDHYGFTFSREKMRLIEPVFSWSSSRKHIFVINEERGYEIKVFDPSGKLIRLIQKPYLKVPVSEEEKAFYMKDLPAAMKASAYFPDFHPPIRGIVAGEDGTLFVSTFEKGDLPGEFVFDIFNTEGIFVARKSFGAIVWENHLWAKIVGDKIYGLREKASGFQELAVYRMRWE